MLNLFKHILWFTFSSMCLFLVSCKKSDLTFSNINYLVCIYELPDGNQILETGIAENGDPVVYETNTGQYRWICSDPHNFNGMMDCLHSEKQNPELITERQFMVNTNPDAEMTPELFEAQVTEICTNYTSHPSNAVFLNFGFLNEKDTNKEDFHPVYFSYIPGLLIPIELPNQVVAFGDSLSDNGNTFNYTKKYTKRLTGQVPLSPRYWNGHFSNGYVMVEQFTQGLLGGLNGGLFVDQAWGGSGVITDGFLYVINRDLNTQVASYQSTFEFARSNVNGFAAAIDPSRIVYSVFSGSNDYMYITQRGLNFVERHALGRNIDKDCKTGGYIFYGACYNYATSKTQSEAEQYLEPCAKACAKQVVLGSIGIQANIENLVQNSEANFIMIPNQPDIRKAPAYNGSRPLAQPALQNQFLDIAVTEHNKHLQTMLNNLNSKYPGKTFVIVDTNQTLDNIVDNGLDPCGTPTEFLDVHNSCFSGTPTTNGFECPLGPNGFLPYQNLFWDDIHPTTVGHCLLKESALKTFDMAIGSGSYTPGCSECYLLRRPTN